MRVHQKRYPKRIDSDPADRSSANYYRNARAMEDHGYVEVPDSVYGGTSRYTLKNGKSIVLKSGLTRAEVERAIEFDERPALAVVKKDPSPARTHERTEIRREPNGVWIVRTESGNAIGRYVSHSSAEEGQREYNRWWATQK